MTTQPAAIRVRAPGRVNLIGDHTDHVGGLVLPMAIDRWTAIKAHRTPGEVRLSSADRDGILQLTLTSTTDPATITPDWGRLVAAVACELGVDAEGFSGSVTTTIPLGSGLSSSAALEVAAALAFGADLPPVELALLCQRAEQRATGVPTGIMDQLCIAGARRGHALLLDCHRLEAEPVAMPEDLVIAVRFVTARELTSSAYGARVAECRLVEARLGPLREATLDDLELLDEVDGPADPELLRRRARHVITEQQRVRDAVDALRAGDLSAFGALMDESHRSLRDDFEVSTADLDRVVTELRQIPGVYGARLTGAGFGGCVVAACAPGTAVDAWIVRPVGAAHRS